VDVPGWVIGDSLALPIPAHSTALREGGETFLTNAFRASGALAAENEVTRITQFEEWQGGSTGRKLLLSVDYARPAPGLHRDLFVKFSRDFANEQRDRARRQMQSEVRLAQMSRIPGFPIAVPACLFADYHDESGTGILITQRIAFGTDGIERHYDKCLDYELPEPLEHYRALIKAIARLAGAHRAGHLPDSVAQQFPFDPDKLSVSERVPYTPKQLQNRVARFSEFAAKYPRLLPLNITSPGFISQLANEVAQFSEHEAAIKQFLRSKPELIALCHWNANIDNAWFWRTPDRELACGLMDWGHVSQMNVAMALWGALSAAEIELWDHHVEALLGLFAEEYRRCGGPSFDIEDLTLHLHLYIAIMGLAWLLDVPALIQTQIPDLADVESRFDPRIRTNEAVRARLQMMNTFLNLWQTKRFGGLLERYTARRRVDRGNP
jgi:hypothetical protein